MIIFTGEETISDESQIASAPEFSPDLRVLNPHCLRDKPMPDLRYLTKLPLP